MVKDKRKYADRAEYLKKAVVKRRKTIRQMAIAYKGILLCANCHREVHEGITQLP